MKILAISHLFPNEAEHRYGIFAARQLSEMARQKGRIDVIVPRVYRPGFLRCFKRWRSDLHDAPLCHYEGLDTLSTPYLRLPGNWYNRWSGLMAFRAMRSSVFRMHRSTPYDIIYATDLFPDGDAALRLARQLSIPAACLAIGVDVNITANSSAAMHRHFVQTVGGLDGMLACGSTVAEGIKQVSNHEPLCVYGVLDLDEFAPADDRRMAKQAVALPVDRLVILYAGYLSRRKGLYELIQAFERILPDCEHALLVLCGHGEELEPLKELVRDKGLIDDVYFAGDVHPDNMSRWMQACDLFVLASHTEGMPNVVMEAMACAAPVISTAVGGLPSAVGDCEGAILVEPRNADALTQALRRVVLDDQLRQRMGLAGRHRAVERFGVRRNAERILAHLEGIVRSQGRSAAN